MEQILIILSVLLVILFLAQLSPAYPIIRARLDVKESFENADADLGNMRQPYYLLQGVIPDNSSKLNAQRCYESKASKNIVLTGNYRQKTNNVMETSPESCLTSLAPF